MYWSVIQHTEAQVFLMSGAGESHDENLGDTTAFNRTLKKVFEGAHERGLVRAHGSARGLT